MSVSGKSSATGALAIAAAAVVVVGSAETIGVDALFEAGASPAVAAGFSFAKTMGGSDFVTADLVAVLFALPIGALGSVLAAAP